VLYRRRVVCGVTHHAALQDPIERLDVLASAQAQRVVQDPLVVGQDFLVDHIYACS
jgi:hypothetical protein